MTSSVLHRNTQLGKLTYDGNLNVSGYDGWTFGHDAEKRLLSVTGHGHSALFAYDGLGRCVKRIIDGATTVFTYDGWKPVAEWTSGGTFVAWNLYGAGADEILVRYQQNPAGYLHYHLDAMGNVQFLLSDQPNPGLERYTYDVFGKPTITGWNGDGRPISNHGNRFLFTGREYLYSFGLYDYRHRTYHPGLGRFIETDPLGQQIEGAKLSAEQTALYGDGAPTMFTSSELNLYRYCHNAPVNKTDPFGLDDSAKFFKAIANFIKKFRPDANGVNPKDVAGAVVKDAKTAEKQERETLRQGHGVNTGHERAYSEFAKDGSLIRSGPNIGQGYNQGPETPLPGPPNGVPQDANRLTGSHSHGPGSGPGLERADVPSANGRLGGLPYISSVGWTGDKGGTIQIYIPGGAGYFHYVNGDYFSGK